MNLEEKLDNILTVYSDIHRRTIPNDENLNEYLKMDSIAAMRILVDIETAFNFEFDDDELGIELFETKDKLLSTIERHLL